jgi:hypothetical protein
LASDEDRLWRAELEHGAVQEGSTVLCSADPVREQADVDVVGYEAVVDDAVGTGVAQIAVGGRG